MAKLEWQLATVTAITKETHRVSTFTLSLPKRRTHGAGQHYELRLTAPDGYVAQRNYSIASEPERKGEIDLTIEKVEDGEVSGFFHDVVQVGDQIEVRGPIGGYFVWRNSYDKDLLLIAGGSGVVPLMSMLRHHKATNATHKVSLLFSSRSIDDIIYRDELELHASRSNVEIHHTLTRSAPETWTGYKRRVDKPMLTELLQAFDQVPRCYVCGNTDFVESVVQNLLSLDVPEKQIRTERFGATGI